MTGIEQHEPIALAAGPWSATLAADGRLADVRFDGVEVLRGLLAAIRDEDWGTVPGDLEVLELDSDQDGFEIVLRSVHRDHRVGFSWTGRITGTAAGRLRYEFDGSADRAFRRNRIGLVVLHPLSLAGSACRIRHPDSTDTESQFPPLVSPHQPFLDVVGMEHDLPGGGTVRIEFEGEVFETEDQRNWSDASFKTYGTPLALPFPVEIAAGERVRQAVEVVVEKRPIAGSRGDPPAEISIAVDRDDVRPWPPIGVGLAPGIELGAEFAARLRPAHLRVDLHAGPDGVSGGDELRRAASTGIPVEVAITVAEGYRPGAVAAAIAGVPTSAVLVFSDGRLTTTGEHRRLVSEELAAAGVLTRLRVGTDANFAELNRGFTPDDAAEADGVVFSLNPQIHDVDPTAIMQTVEALPAMIETARRRCGVGEVSVTPITLKPRRNVYAKDATTGHSEPPADPRQREEFTAAWSVAVMNALLDAEAASATFYEHAGSRGLAVDGSGEATFPVFDVIAAFAAGSHRIAVRSSEPAAVAAVGVRTGEGDRLALANLTLRPRTVVVGESEPVELPPHTAVVIELGPGGGRR